MAPGRLDGSLQNKERQEQAGVFYISSLRRVVCIFYHVSHVEITLVREVQALDVWWMASSTLPLLTLTALLLSLPLLYFFTSLCL